MDRSRRVILPIYGERWRGPGKVQNLPRRDRGTTTAISNSQATKRREEARKGAKRAREVRQSTRCFSCPACLLVAACLWYVGRALARAGSGSHSTEFRFKVAAVSKAATASETATVSKKGTKGPQGLRDTLGHEAKATPGGMLVHPSVPQDSCVML